MDWAEEVQKEIISQIQLWEQRKLSHSKLLQWSQAYYNTLNFKDKYQDYRIKYRHEKIHTILYWYLSSLNCKFIEYVHAPRMIQILQEDDLHYGFPTELTHKNHAFTLKRAIRLKNHPFYKKHSKLILNLDVNKAWLDKDFTKTAFKRSFRYLTRLPGARLGHPIKKSKFVHSLHLHLHSHNQDEFHIFFNGFSGVNLYPKHEDYFSPFEFRVDHTKEVCTLHLGELFTQTEDNRVHLIQSTSEPCPYKFELDYEYYKRFSTKQYYIYLTKPKLKNNNFQKGFWGYWE